MLPSSLFAIGWLAAVLVLSTSCQHHGAGRTARPAEPVSFPTSDGGRIHGDLYGSGPHGVVLVHGGRFDKGSWREQATVLADVGLMALAIDLRGYGDSVGGTQENSEWEGFALDVVGAMRYLRDQRGAERVSLVGGSMGGWAAARASVLASTRDGPDEIDALVLLAHSSIEHPERMRARRMLFIVSEGDPFADGSLRQVAVRDQYELARCDDKELVVVGGEAHAQWMFASEEEGERVLEAVVGFLLGSD